ncbi:MAG TPA: hypothetical protein VM010_02105, partial [Chitinophagaceae bacterium]|nr:hypothetical protein [Chitinophagaceae bacterium]
MHGTILIADSGSTKAEWSVVQQKKVIHTISTKGISPYFLNTAQIADLLYTELLPQLDQAAVNQIFYYGAGCAAKANQKIVEAALAQTFSNAHIQVTHDLMGAARAVCGHQKGIACILGTGS